MLKIRLRRVGAKKQPRYRVVVAESTAPRDGRFVEIIGHYNPLTHPSTIVIDTAKADRWMRNGAQPTDRVAKLLAIAREKQGGPVPVEGESVAAPTPVVAPVAVDAAPTAGSDAATGE